MEFFGAAHQHLASDDCLDAEIGRSDRRQDGLAIEPQRDTPATAAGRRLRAQSPGANEPQLVARHAGLAERPARLDVHDLVRHRIEQVGEKWLQTCRDQCVAQRYARRRRDQTPTRHMLAPLGPKMRLLSRQGKLLNTR
jgi:hypothetical protein